MGGHVLHMLRREKECVEPWGARSVSTGPQVRSSLIMNFCNRDLIMHWENKDNDRNNKYVSNRNFHKSTNVFMNIIIRLLLLQIIIITMTVTIIIIIYFTFYQYSSFIIIIVLSLFFFRI